MTQVQMQIDLGWAINALVQRYLADKPDLTRQTAENALRDAITDLDELFAKEAT